MSDPGRASPSSPSRARTTTAMRCSHSSWSAPTPARLARRRRAAARDGRRRPPGRVLVRRLPPLRSDRPLRAGDGRGRRFAAAGGPVLGICNGFQILCEAGLLPGILRRTGSSSSSAGTSTSRSSSTDSPFTAACAVGDELVIPIKHGEGNWFARCRAARRARGARADRVPLRATTSTAPSTGSPASRTQAGNVLGLMPHPEHAVDELLGPTGGLPVLAGLISAARAFAPLPA